MTSENAVWRGFMLDEARHFFGKNAVLSILDFMADLRLNIFHWHLVDDQGWRIDIPGMPKLVQYGAVRRSTPVLTDPVRDDGVAYGPYYYTSGDIREIVKYAKDRGIEVVPEIEMPGHVRAMLAAYPELACSPSHIDRSAWTRFGVCKDVLCVGNANAIEHSRRILDEVMEMFQGPYIHIGGDECPTDSWRTCSLCQAGMRARGFRQEQELHGWWVGEMAEYVARHGLRPVGWEEILSAPSLPGGTIVQCWARASSVKKAAARGLSVLMSPAQKTYLSFPDGRADDPYPYLPWARKQMLTCEDLLEFDPCRGLEAGTRSRVIGAECCVWSEMIDSIESLRSKIQDRLPAFAVAMGRCCARSDANAR